MQKHQHNQLPAPLPRCHLCVQGHLHVTFPRTTGLPPHQPLLLPPACTVLPVLPARDGEGVQSSPFPTPGRRAVAPSRCTLGQAGKGSAGEGWQLLPVAAPGRMRPVVATMRYPESLKCILNNKRSTNSCAIFLIKMPEMLQGAAPQSWPRGAPGAAGQPGPKSLRLFAIKLLGDVWGSCGRPKVQRDTSQHSDGPGHRRLGQVWRCPRCASRRARQVGSLCPCPVSPLRRLGSRPGSFPTQIHLCQSWGGDGASLDPHQSGCGAKGARTSRDIPEDRARGQRSTAGPGTAPPPHELTAPLGAQSDSFVLLCWRWARRERCDGRGARLGERRGPPAPSHHPRLLGTGGDASGSGSARAVPNPGISSWRRKPGCQPQSAVKSQFNAHNPPTSQARWGETRAGAEISVRGCQRLISGGGLAVGFPGNVCGSFHCSAVPVPSAEINKVIMEANNGQGENGRGGSGRKEPSAGRAGGAPGEGAVCGGCGAPRGEPLTRRGVRETRIPWGLDAAGMPPPAPAAGEGASASPSPSVTAADAAGLDHIVRQQPAWVCPASGGAGRWSRPVCLAN